MIWTVLLIIFILADVVFGILFIMQLMKHNKMKSSENFKCPDYLCGNDKTSTDEACTDGKSTVYPPYRTGKDGKIVCRSQLMSVEPDYS